MADKTREGLNFQKRGVSVFVADLEEVGVLDDSVYGNLPEKSLIMSAGVLVTTASGTATATVDVLVGATVVANEIDVDDTGFKAGTVTEDAQYFETGGQIIVREGAVAPAAGDLVGRLVIEYIELDKTTGEYTTMTQ